jgi:dodecin
VNEWTRRNCASALFQTRAHSPALFGGNAVSPATQKEDTMDTVARISEISASSSKSFDDAINIGIARAVKTLKNVEGAWVQDQKIVVKNGNIVAYRVNLKVTFVLTD